MHGNSASTLRVLPGHACLRLCLPTAQPRNQAAAGQAAGTRAAAGCTLGAFLVHTQKKHKGVPVAAGWSTKHLPWSGQVWDQGPGRQAERFLVLKGYCGSSSNGGNISSSGHPAHIPGACLPAWLAPRLPGLGPLPNVFAGSVQAIHDGMSQPRGECKGEFV